MQEMKIDQKSGFIIMSDFIIGPAVTYGKLKCHFLDNISLICGAEGSGKYALKQKVRLLGQDFRVYFILLMAKFAAYQLF